MHATYTCGCKDKKMCLIAKTTSVFLPCVTVYYKILTKESDAFKIHIKSV